MKKKTGIELKSLEECTGAMGDLLLVTTQLESMIADRDAAVAKTTAIWDSGIDEARARMAELHEGLKSYYYGHLGEVERDGKKSVQLATGVMGRRDNPVKLALKNRTWNWEAVLAALQESEFSQGFVRRVESIDKDLVRAQMPVERLGEFGMRLEQGETWYAEPARLPEAEPRAGGRG